MEILSQTSQRPQSPLSYLPQLDSIRAFAVLLVLWHHWCGTPQGHLGAYGVWIFFVISGFLITRILLKSRRPTAGENRHSLSNFYVRRFLRIFPLYYFVLLLCFATSATFRGVWCWYAVYLQNLKFILANNYVFASHLWSLAVEEQFYVFWPLLILFSPRAILLPIIVAAGGMAVATRIICTMAGWSALQVYVFTFSNLDTLALGAVLGYVVTYHRERVSRLRRTALVAGVALFAAAALGHIFILDIALRQLSVGLMAMWLVSSAADGFRGPVGRALSFAPLIYVGRISYGIYIYHFFMPNELRPMLRRLHMQDHGGVFVAICFVMTMLVASASWFFLESPINSLKARFPLKSPPYAERRC